jgi:hypothetical protein
VISDKRHQVMGATSHHPQHARGMQNARKGPWLALLTSAAPGGFSSCS